MPALHTVGPRDQELIDALAAIGEALSLRNHNNTESEWVEQITQLATSHPDPFVRAHLTTSATLRQLHQFATDTHLTVRLLVAESPLCIDADLQLTLAADHDELVIHTMLNNIDPYVDTVKALMSSPHVSVRRRLANMNLREELLDYLSLDSDTSVSSAALATLSQRHARRVSA